eukprot:m.247600 g.247600  ORF g.247600 m.247600 type:complete len:631 (-) comp15396_c0_seq1:332-2224(-)
MDTFGESGSLAVQVKPARKMHPLARSVTSSSMTSNSPDRAGSYTPYSKPASQPTVAATPPSTTQSLLALGVSPTPSSSTAATATTTTHHTRPRSRSRTDVYQRWQRNRAELIQRSSKAIVLIANIRNHIHEELRSFINDRFAGDIRHLEITDDLPFGFAEMSSLDALQALVNQLNKSGMDLHAERTLELTPNSCPRLLVDTTSNALVVKNLPYDITEDQLQSELECVGILNGEIELRYDQKHAFTGTAFVSFDSTEDAIHAGHILSAIRIKSRLMRVEFKRGDRSASRSVTRTKGSLPISHSLTSPDIPSSLEAIPNATHVPGRARSKSFKTGDPRAYEPAGRRAQTFNESHASVAAAREAALAHHNGGATASANANTAAPKAFTRKSGPGAARRGATPSPSAASPGRHGTSSPSRRSRASPHVSHAKPSQQHSWRTRSRTTSERSVSPSPARQSGSASRNSPIPFVSPVSGTSQQPAIERDPYKPPNSGAVGFSGSAQMRRKGKAVHQPGVSLAMPLAVLHSEDSDPLSSHTQQPQQLQKQKQLQPKHHLRQQRSRPGQKRPARSKATTSASAASSPTRSTVPLSASSPALRQADKDMLDMGSLDDACNDVNDAYLEDMPWVHPAQSVN